MHIQNVPRQNVPRPNVPGTKRPRDKTSQGTKRPKGQNVPRDKTSQGTKRPKGQNVRNNTRGREVLPSYTGRNTVILEGEKFYPATLVEIL